MKSRRDAQRGFTLIELMVAGTISLILLAAIGGVLSDSLRTAAALNSQVAINRHAREIFEILAFGGSNENANTTASGSVLPFNYVFGLRGRNPTIIVADPFKMPKVENSQNPFLSRSADGGTRLYRFGLGRDGSVPLGNPVDAQLAEQIQEVTVPCTGTDLPVQGCAVATSATMQGYLRSDPTLSTSASRGGITTLAFQLIDPQVQGAPHAYNTDYTVTYWTAFTGLQDKPLPW
ncbi:prepilin-type N-terminal cleavage/methylation domain-containing protein [Azospirillum sp. Sh1]|uniref:PulJ/GspJ family protein n=1 Tax=Azospirillum sp. Sh1 TaxID=2607285 RepID=UPI0011ECB7E9|nr:prepilin-type N-terminal cleavage/methylation domain-containing protein [Azospirillum sp. Sh1]KAA0571165.1 prepilin-type N-terminal cleavage/methylation domain-containing protein [Azospirillum sp. Sh1]